jgi:hypothetical protein
VLEVDGERRKNQAFRKVLSKRAQGELKRESEHYRPPIFLFFFI